MTETFFKYLKQYSDKWKKECSEEIMDSESWEIKIKADAVTFSCHGHITRPGN
jgi:hypothetical protein